MWAYHFISVCPAGYAQYKKRCFRFAEIEVNATEAQSSCEKEGQVSWAAPATLSKADSPFAIDFIRAIGGE